MAYRTAQLAELRVLHCSTSERQHICEKLVVLAGQAVDGFERIALREPDFAWPCGEHVAASSLHEMFGQDFALLFRQPLHVHVLEPLVQQAQQRPETFLRYRCEAWR